MLYLRFLVVATLSGVLLSDEQVQSKQYREFMIKDQKSYRNDLKEVAKRFEVFKVMHTPASCMQHIATPHVMLGEPGASPAA